MLDLADARPSDEAATSTGSCPTRTRTASTSTSSTAPTTRRSTATTSATSPRARSSSSRRACRRSTTSACWPARTTRGGRADRRGPRDQPARLHARRDRGRARAAGRPPPARPDPAAEHAPGVRRRPGRRRRRPAPASPASGAPTTCPLRSRSTSSTGAIEVSHRSREARSWRENLALDLGDAHRYERPVRRLRTARRASRVRDAWPPHLGRTAEVSRSRLRGPPRPMPAGPIEPRPGDRCWNGTGDESVGRVGCAASLRWNPTTPWPTQLRAQTQDGPSARDHRCRLRGRRSGAVLRSISSRPRPRSTGSTRSGSLPKIALLSSRAAGWPCGGTSSATLIARTRSTTPPRRSCRTSSRGPSAGTGSVEYGLDVDGSHPGVAGLRVPRCRVRGRPLDAAPRREPDPAAVFHVLQHRPTRRATTSRRCWTRSSGSRPSSSAIESSARWSPRSTRLNGLAD